MTALLRSHQSDIPPATRPSGGGATLPPKARGWRAALRRGALALLGAELAYVAVANAALSSGLVARAVTQDDLELGLRYEGAWSIVPGLVSFQHAAFQSQDSNVEWQVEVFEGRVFVRLWALAKKQISLGHVRGEGVVFRFRHRVEPDGAKRPATAAYPPIFGLDDPPLFEQRGPGGPPKDPLTYWNVALDDVDVGVKEVWAQEYRYEGPGRARGAFQLAPARRVWVGPAELELFGGTISAAGRPVARGVEGLLRADVPEFDVNVPKGIEVLRQISGTVDLAMQIEGLSFLDLYALPWGAEARDGSGQLSTRVRFERGVVAPESRVHYETGRLALRRGDASIVAAATALWAAGEGGSSLALDVPFASLWAGRGGGAVAWAQGASASLTMPEPDLGSAATWLPRTTRFGVAAAGVDDLSRLRALAGEPEGWPLRRGSVRASGVLRTREGGEASVEARAKAEGVELAIDEGRWSGSLSATASLGPFVPRALAEAPGLVRVEGRDIAFLPSRGPGREGFWFSLDVNGVRLALAPAFGARAAWSLRARDLSPISAPLAATGRVPAWFIKWLEPEGVAASGGIAYAPGQLDIEVGSARAGALDAKGRYRHSPAGSRGAFCVALGPLAVGLRLSRGGLDCTWPVDGGWLAGESRALF